MIQARTIIQTKNLQKVFALDNQSVVGLDKITMTVHPGEFLAIMGPSGSGKSTLLYLLGGLDRPSSGMLMIAGQRLDAMSGEDLAIFRRETVGFVFQAFHLVPTITALDNVALPGVFTGMPDTQRKDRAWHLLKALGLENRIDHLPAQLSGGQQQRVAIARALFNDPPIIMADEPTGALDSTTGRSVMQMLKTLCDRYHKTVIVVTHDPNIARYATRIQHLKDGRLATASDPMQQLLSRY